MAPALLAIRELLGLSSLELLTIAALILLLLIVVLLVHGRELGVSDRRWRDGRRHTVIWIKTPASRRFVEGVVQFLLALSVGQRNKNGS